MLSLLRLPPDLCVSGYMLVLGHTTNQLTVQNESFGAWSASTSITSALVVRSDGFVAAIWLDAALERTNEGPLKFRPFRGLRGVNCLTAVAELRNTEPLPLSTAFNTAPLAKQVPARYSDAFTGWSICSSLPPSANSDPSPILLISTPLGFPHAILAKSED